MIAVGAVRSGLAAARGALRAAALVGAHAAWWLDYRVGGQPRKAPEDPRRRSATPR